MSFYIYLGLLSILPVVGIVSFIASKKVFLDELKSNVKLDISLAQMQESEKNIENFYKNCNLGMNVSIHEIARILNVEDKGDDHLLSSQAHISEPDEQGTKNVIFRSGWSREDKRFLLAHECAHIINGDSLPNDRSDGKNKPLSEQLADYTAAALLMPKERVCADLKESNYANLSARKRVIVVEKMCRDYEVNQIIALRRIKEVCELNQKC